MPTPQEKIVQIEAAFRQRFFPLVPKKGPANWTEEQHDTDRLSRALAAYAIVGLCDIDDATAAGCITDGGDDGGIDSLYFDRPGNRVVFVQAKFKRGGVAPNQAEVLKTINGLRMLMDRRFGEFNQSFQDRLDEIEAALDTAGAQVEIVLAFLGEDLGPHATTDLDAFRDEVNRLSPRMAWSNVGLSKLYGWLLAEQTPSTIDAEVALESWAAIIGPRKAVYGQITAASLAELVENHGKALFERNIRHYLGSVGVNLAIERTVRSRPADFFYLNNGLTAVAETITQAAGNQDRCVFGLKNLSIVNGAQTAGAIATAAVNGEISLDAKLLITVIEIGAAMGDFGMEITRARNHQNVVRGIDFAALDSNQERLRQELASVRITYHYRPSAEARARRDDAFTVEEAALALTCLSFPVVHSRDIPTTQRRAHPNAIDFVVTAKKEIGRLWEQDGSNYRQIFTSSISGLRICRSVRIYRFVDRILAASEKAETDYYRRMFFRHGRYFVMAFIGQRLPEVLGRSELTLSNADVTLLSQRTNELSEMIYAVAESMRLKGYLAIFRNLTDAQPLANAVLDRLAEQDAADQQAASSTPTSTASPSSGTN